MRYNLGIITLRNTIDNAITFMSLEASTLSDNIESNYHSVGKSIDLYFSQGLHFSTGWWPRLCPGTVEGSLNYSWSYLVNSAVLRVVQRSHYYPWIVSSQQLALLQCCWQRKRFQRHDYWPHRPLVVIMGWSNKKLDNNANAKLGQLNYS